MGFMTKTGKLNADERFPATPIDLKGRLAKKREALFLAALFLYVLARGVGMLVFASPWALLAEIATKLAQALALLLLFGAIVGGLRRRRAGYYVVLVLYGLMIAVSSLVSATYEFVWLLALVLAGEGVQLRRIARCVLLASGVVLVVALSTVALGVSEMVVVKRAEGGLRFALGFYHPNRLVQEVLVMIMASLTVFYGTRKVAVAAVLGLAVAAAAMFVTDTRTALVGAAGAIGIFALLSVCKDRVDIKLLSRLIGAMVAIIAVGSIACVLLYSPGNAPLEFVDSMLSGRLSLPKALLDTGAIGPFGFNNEGSSSLIADVISLEASEVPLDNAYVRLLVINGPIALTALLVAFLMPLFVKEGSRQMRFELLAGIALCALLGIVESYVLDPAFNFYLIHQGAAFLTLFDQRGKHLKNRVAVLEGEGNRER